MNPVKLVRAAICLAALLIPVGLVAPATSLASQPQTERSASEEKTVERIPRSELPAWTTDQVPPGTTFADMVTVVTVKEPDSTSTGTSDDPPVTPQDSHKCRPIGSSYPTCHDITGNGLLVDEWTTSSWSTRPDPEAYFEVNGVVTMIWGWEDSPIGFHEVESGVTPTTFADGTKLCNFWTGVYRLDMVCSDIKR